MLKLRKYIKGYTRIYVHGTVKDRDVNLQGKLDKPEWVSRDIDLPHPITLQRREWRNLHTGEYIGCSLILSEIENYTLVQWMCYQLQSQHHRRTRTWYRCKQRTVFLPDHR